MPAYIKEFFERPAELRRIAKTAVTKAKELRVGGWGGGW
jgi:hypothetical protein